MIAISSLEDVVDSLKGGTIQFQYLDLLRDNAQRFLMLCEYMGKTEGNKSTLPDILEQRCNELVAFEGERVKVSTFIRMCINIKQGK